MKTLNGQEAFAALMAGKNIMCRAIGGLIEFDDLAQFPATVFAMPDYEFCVKISEITINGFTFLKPYSLDELAEGQDVFLLGNTGSIIKGQFIPEYEDLVFAVKNGSVQRDFESAQKQAKAIQSLLGIDNDLVLKVVDFKEFIKPATKSKKTTRKKMTDTSVAIAEVKPSGEESTDFPWEATVDTATKAETKHSYTLDDIEVIEEDPLKIVEKFAAQISACTTTDPALKLRHSFAANGHLDDTHVHHLMKLVEDKCLELDPEQYTPKTGIEIISQENVTTSEDSLINETVEQEIAAEEAIKHQEHLNEILNDVALANSPAEVNAHIRYTRSWTEEQRKPVMTAINKRLVELTAVNPVEISQSPSLMVRIQSASTEHELNELLPEVRSRHPDIQPKLMDCVKKRRFELKNKVVTS